MVFYLLGHMAIFNVAQMVIHYQMEEEKLNQVELMIPLKYFETHLLRQGKEIRWEGKLFDIKSKTHDGAIVRVLAIEDKKEASLFKMFAKLLKDEESSHASHSKTSVKIPYLETLLVDHFSSNLIAGNFLFHGEVTLEVLPGYHAIKIPPPKNLLN